MLFGSVISVCLAYKPGLAYLVQVQLARDGAAHSYL